MSTSPDDSSKIPAGQTLRIFTGEGSANRQVTDYVVLIASDTDLPQREVMRAALTDVIGRNGRVMDNKLVDEILDAYAADGGYDFNRYDAGLQESRRKVLKGSSETPFEGYAVHADGGFQNGVLSYVDAKYPRLPLDDSSPEAQARMLEALKNLKSIAEAAGNGPAKEAIDAITQSIEARDGSALAGVGGAAAAFKTVIELTRQAVDSDTTSPSVLTAIESIGGAKKLGADAAELLGRTASILTLPLDATKLGVGFYKLTQGKNEKGEPLSNGEYFSLATDLASDGLSTATGTAELLAAFGKGGAAAETLASWAPPLAAVTAWAKLNYEVVKLGGEAIQSTMEYEVASRFAVGKDGKTAFLGIEREKERVAELPTGPNNARRSAESIINNIEEADTRGRFIQYLKRTIEPDDYVTKIASTKGGETIPPEQMERLAKQIQKSYPRFVAAEYEDVKNFVLQKQDGLVVFKTPQVRGEYLNKPSSDGVVDVTKAPPKPSETRRDSLLPEIFPKMPGTTDLLKGVDLKGRSEETQPKLQSQAAPVRTPASLEKEERVVAGVTEQLPSRSPGEVRQVAVELQKSGIRDNVDIQQVVANKDQSVVFGVEKNAAFPSGYKQTSANVEEAVTRDLTASTSELARMEESNLQGQDQVQAKKNQAIG